jgi:hypothetical protein
VPHYPVTVTASYLAEGAPHGTIERLEAWEASSDGRTFVVDASIAPVRWTATADYLVDAPNPQDAERTALDRFLADASQAGIPAPETILAATGPLA